MDQQVASRLRTDLLPLRAPLSLAQESAELDAGLSFTKHFRH